MSNNTCMASNCYENKKIENIKITYNKNMKIIFKTKELVDKVKNIEPTAEAKQTLMILGNMVIKVESGKAYFTASDLEIQVSSSAECDSDEDCEFSLPARKLLEILNALSTYDTVTFTISDSKVDITAGKSKISLPNLPTIDFPYMDVEELGEDKFTREILQYCSTKNVMNYIEAELQFKYKVLLSKDYYNKIINCRIGGANILEELKSNYNLKL